MTDLAAAYAGWRASTLAQITERLERDLVFDLAGPVAGRRVLDAGTGDGTYALEAVRLGASVLAIDTDPAMLAAARRRADERRAAVDLVCAPIEAVPAKDGAFDLVLASTVLCFVHDARAALRELARVLAPGGRLVLGELGRWSWWAPMRRVRGWLGNETWRRAHFWSRRDLVRLVESAGMRVVDVRGAVHYPRSSSFARLCAPLDPLLGRLSAPGAAFLAISADKKGSS